MKSKIVLYEGKAQGNGIGGFTHKGFYFDIIRPGLDAQGRKRLTWTQFIYDGIPVFEVKITTDLPTAMKKFDELWGKHIGDDLDLARKALERSKIDRISKFKDGVTGESAAPSVVPDGREGKIYQA